MTVFIVRLSLLLKRYGRPWLRLWPARSRRSRKKKREKEG